MCIGVGQGIALAHRARRVNGDRRDRARRRRRGRHVRQSAGQCAVAAGARGLLAAIEALDADPAVRAIVLAGAGRNFIAGADVREFDRPPREPLLPAVLSRLEACGKPVVAALHGATLGGGAETALACHYRCAAGDLQLGFPEVSLGLLPGRRRHGTAAAARRLAGLARR